MKVLDMKKMLEGFNNNGDIKIKIAGEQKDIECVHYNVSNKTVILVTENDCDDNVKLEESNEGA